MTALAILLIGFSLCSAFILALTHFRFERYQGQLLSRSMGLLLLLALSSLQLAHFGWLYLDQDWINTPGYRIALFLVAPAFFLFSQPLLSLQPRSSNRLLILGHAIPVILAPLLPNQLALPLAFMVGACYLLWLGRRLYVLRQERAGFQLEILLLGAVFVIAIAVSVLGLVQTLLPDKLFFKLYAMAISSAFLLVQLTLGLRPELPAQVQETVQTAYASSTLTNVDCDQALANLASLMHNERVFENPEVNLPSLAEQLQLSGHQLSELLNTRLGKGFSRYLREQRIDAAKLMLRHQPSASVMSVGLSVGFTSQSNFYDAFREIEGMTPGQYRKLNPAS